MEIKTAGIRLVRACGPHIELYFDWQKLPPLDLTQEYYLVAFTPDSPVAPVEMARPNSAGPLYFCLKENVPYRLDLLRTPHLEFEVERAPEPRPEITLVAEHENLHALVWSKTNPERETDGDLVVFADGRFHGTVPTDSDPKLEIGNRPHTIRVETANGSELFAVTTNLQRTESVETLRFTLEKEEMDLFLSPIVKPQPGWNLRMESTPYFQNHAEWWSAFQRRFPGTDSSRIVGLFRLFQDSAEPTEVRTFGFGCNVEHSFVEQIQISEWKLENALPVKRFKLQLQITSAHRELYKTPILEKTYPAPLDKRHIGFDAREVADAQRRLFERDSSVSWEHSFIELVVWFRCEKRDWQEFQRETAYCCRWEFAPDGRTRSCHAEWILSDLENPENRVTMQQTGSVSRSFWPAGVSIKPYHDRKLLAWWDLDRNGVESFLQKEWGVTLGEVRFFLKVHEEHLGDRIHRADLDCPLVELFSRHRSVYFDVDDNRCYAAEIVARHQNRELALTPISDRLVVPRSETAPPQEAQNNLRYGAHWFHPSQREVRHRHGHDSGNLAKVLIHLHMHSPNLFRADPFREAFLKAKTWPLKTADGTEVHNLPGEWIMKNCLDSWLPLLRVFRTLVRDGVDFQVSINITPPVAYALNSPKFKDYMSRYLLRVRAHTRTQIALMKSMRHSPDYIWAAERYLEDVCALDSFYNDEIAKNPIGAFRELELAGFLEIQTCTATHGMPGLMAGTPDSLDAQMALAARSHHRLFGDRPKGIWLAENSFFPGIERYLQKEGLRYFFVEAEAVLKGSFCPKEEEYNPIIIPESDVVAFGRSRLGRTQVWDAEIGYAGHPDFKEYHFRHMGLPIKRITSKTSNEKLPYHPDRAEKTARMLACDFHRKLTEKAWELSKTQFAGPPLVTCTYDAELFGHHWAEGPIFVEELFREFYRKGDEIGLTTPSHYLAQKPKLPVCNPNPSTWGHKTFHMRWSDPKVSWTFRELERADKLLKRYLAIASKGDFNPFQTRAVTQMGAELVRAFSSDLTFVIMAGDFEEDMQREIRKYLDYFYRLKYLIDNGFENRTFLQFRQYENDMFPEIEEYYRTN